MSWWFFAVVIFGYFGPVIYRSTHYLLVYGAEPANNLLQYTDANLLAGTVEQIFALSLGLAALGAAGWRIQDLPFHFNLAALVLTTVLFVFMFFESVAYGHIIHNWLGIETGYQELEVNLQSSWHTIFGAMDGGQLALPVIILASIVIGLFEELFVLGFVIRFFERRNHPRWLDHAIITSVIIRVSYHTYQGAVWLPSHAIMGVLFALCYLRWRNLLPFVACHALLDIWAFMAAWAGWQLLMV